MITKLRACLRILRGRPVAYRLRIYGGTLLVKPGDGALVTECEFLAGGWITDTVPDAAEMQARANAIGAKIRQARGRAWARTI